MGIFAARVTVRKEITVNQKEFNSGLQRHLMKCELEYRANMLPSGSCVDWLSEHCGSTNEIAGFLREIGFRIRAIVDEETCLPGEYHRWVITTNGVCVYVNDRYLRGFVARAGK